MDYLKRLDESATYIRQRLKVKPEIAIVLGSGLSGLLDDMVDKMEIDYADIPNFPHTTVQGHEGKLVIGYLSGKPVIVMKGRFHYYEGYDIKDVVYHIRLFKLLEIKKLIVTNAAGGINKSFKPGDLMLIKDHIGLFAPSPLRGKNLDEFGVRFPDMSEVYSKEAMVIVEKAAHNIGISLVKGVYVYAKGPEYETPHEVRALSVLGGDAVGMSTVPEAVAARHCGMSIIGISCITNMAAGIVDSELSHQDVTQTAQAVSKKFKMLLKNVVGEWD